MAVNLFILFIVCSYTLFSSSSFPKVHCTLDLPRDHAPFFFKDNL